MTDVLNSWVSVNRSSTRTVKDTLNGTSLIALEVSRYINGTCILSSIARCPYVSGCLCNDRTVDLYISNH